MPYIKGLSENFRQMLNGYDLDAVHSILNKLNCIIKKYKDKITTNNKTELV